MNNITYKLALLFLIIFSNLTFAKTPVLNTGSGVFLVDGAAGIEALTIGVNYYKPENFTKDSPILIVLPGNGRNGAKYRDRWIESSNKYGALILSLTYAKKFYPRTIHYTLARMSVENNGIYTLAKNPKDWIFTDFDTIFDIVVSSTNSSQTTYDLFGHSAGGQIGHRLAIFSPHNKVNRIVSANSGWYTTTDFSASFPYGLKDSIVEEAKMKTNLKSSFAKHLTVFLGDKDDKNETRGDLRRRPEANKQGDSRIERGKYFFEKSKNHAKELGYKFNWKLKFIPNVGHSSTKMSKAAGQYLYEKKI